MAYTTPPTWQPGNPPTAAELNATVRDDMKTMGEAWTAYTPTLGGWTLSNGTLTGAWMPAGAFILGRVAYTVGSSDTKSGAPIFGFPAQPRQEFGACIGQAGLFDTSAGNRAFRFVLLSTSGGGTMAISDLDDTRISPTAPWTWATGDQMLLEFRIERA